MTIEQWCNSAQVADGRGHFWAIVREGNFYRIESQDEQESLYTLQSLAAWLVSLGSYTYDPPDRITIDSELFRMTESEKQNLNQ